MIVHALRASVRFWAGFSPVCAPSNKNLYKLWSIFGSVINPSKKKKHNNIDHLIYGQRKITDDQEIADTINTHFSTIGQTLSAKINSSKSFKDYLSCSNINSLFLKPAHEEELVKEICQLNSKKAGGHDNISPKILKENTDIFVTPLLHLIYLSFQTSIVPDKLKIARVIPIHKKEDRFCVDNYRPISLLSTVNKLLEKLMHKRLVSFLNQHKILYKYQFGFRQNYSTTLALIEITDNILQDLENGKFVCGIYLDLSKAFDTVDHTILLSKLHYYGIRGEPLCWFRNYLSNRRQYTLCNGKKVFTKKYYPRGASRLCIGTSALPDIY